MRLIASVKPNRSSGKCLLRVCYFGTYRAEYSRNQIMLEGLRCAGADVVECHAPLWASIEDRVQAASGGWVNLHFGVRVLRTYLALLNKYRRVGDYDVMVVGYPGQFDVYLARLLTWLRRKPLAWDVFMSIYLIAVERGLNVHSPLTVWAIRQVERFACRLPDRLILDTAEYVEWFHRTHGVEPARFRLVPTGADDRVYKAVDAPLPDSGHFTLIYYGTFIPNHGVLTIVEAAHLLAGDPAVRFVLVGRGPDKDAALALTQQCNLDNVTFVDWVEREELPMHVARADVCLGVFGTTPQSQMTVQNKIYEALAMRKPIITADSPTVRAVFRHLEHVFLCERANPQALADAIRALQCDPALRQRLAENGYRLFHAQFDLMHNGQRYAAHLQELVS
jgi:glycosyltransferase involved in cell wall biosynthesis